MTKKEAYDLGVKLGSLESRLKLLAAKWTGLPSDIPTALRYYLMGPAGTALGVGTAAGGINALVQAAGDEKFDSKQMLQTALSTGTLGGMGHLGSRLGRGAATGSSVLLGKKFPKLQPKLEGLPLHLAGTVGAALGTGAGIVSGGKLLGTSPSRDELLEAIEAEGQKA